MADKWSDVIAKPEYQALPDDQKADAQNQYFDSVVAPNLSSGDVGDARNQFFSAYPAPKPAPIPQPAQTGQSQPLPPVGASAPGSPTASPRPATPQPPPEQPGMLDRIGNFFTGADRQTRATKELPELQNSGLLAGAGVSPAKAAQISATLLTTYDPAEAAKILQAASPDIGVETDEKGNILVANNKTGARAVVNKPGASAMDALQLGATTALYSPAGGAAGAVGGGVLKGAAAVAGASAATEAGIQAAQAAAGGTFDPADVAMAGAGGAAGEVLARGAGALGRAVRDNIASRRAQGENLTQNFDAAVAGGESPEAAAQRLIGDQPSPVQPAPQSVVEAATAGRRSADKKLDTLVNQANPDQGVINAAQQLGISEPLPPGAIIQDPATLGVVQGLASKVGSPLGAQQDAFHDALGSRADQFITDFGGSTDKAAVSANFRDQSLDAINDLGRQSTESYGRVAAAVPRDTPAPATDSLAHFDNRLSGLNNDPSLLSDAEKKVRSILAVDPDAGKAPVEIGGLKVPERHADTARSLAQEADNIVAGYGGSFDKAAVSDAFKTQTNDAIDQLEAQSDALYQGVKQAIPGKTQVPAANTVGYVRARQAELGDKRLLNRDQQRALSVLAPQTIAVPKGALFPGQVENRIIHPNYAAIDRVRKELGMAYKGKGAFKDLEDTDRDALYSALSRDQEAAVNSISPELGAQYQQAKALVAQRKGMEEGLQAAIGKDQSGAITSTVSSALKALAKGNFQAFDRSMATIPDSLKQQVLMTGIGDVAAGGKGRDLNIPALTAFWSNLSQNAGAKARLTQWLHPDAVQRLDNLASNAGRLQDVVTGKTPDGTLRTPTFQALDTARQRIDPVIQQIHAKARAGEMLTDQDYADLALHQSLLSDQRRVADAHGVAGEFDNARALAAERAHWHGNLVSLLGKEFNDAITSKVGYAMDGLRKGEVARFEAVMDKMPPAMQRQVVMTALNSAFTSGGRSTSRGINAPGFAKYWDELSRHPTAKTALMKYLPSAAQTDLENIAKVGKGLGNALNKNIHSGRILDVLKGYTESDGVIARLWDTGKKVAVASGVTSLFGHPVLGVLAVLASKWAAREKPLIDVTASALLGSDRFLDALKAFAAAGGTMRSNVVAREKQLMRTAVYKRWVAALGHESAARVAAVGPLTYLTESTRNRGDQLPAAR